MSSNAWLLNPEGVIGESELVFILSADNVDEAMRIIKDIRLSTKNLNKY